MLCVVSLVTELECSLKRKRVENKWERYVTSAQDLQAQGLPLSESSETSKLPS
jgi:hypothetical protein